MSTDSDTAEKRSKLSPAKLALLEKRLRGEAAGKAPRSRISRRQQENFVPISFAQQRLWFLDQLEPESPAYNISTAFKLSGSLDVEALSTAINAVVARHEILRTSFRVLERGPVQVISAELTPNLPLEDLSNLREATQQDELRRLATENARRPFDLTRCPLFRTHLVRLSETEHILLLTIHHIISDAWSFDIFFREMTEAYVSYRDNNDSTLEELPVQYADFSVWQRDWAEKGALAQQLAYWRKQLADPPDALDLPTDKPRPQQLSFRGALQSAEFSGALIEGLRGLARQENVTLFMLLLAAFNALLARYSGQDDILVGSPIAGRHHMETESLIGLFVNTMVLRTHLSGNPSFRELLRQTKENTLAAYANQDVPLEKLVEELRPARGVGHSPFFQVMLDFKRAIGSGSQAANWQIENLELDRGTARADLLLFLTEEENSLACVLEYSTDLFEPATMKRLLRHFEVLLAGVVRNPNQRVSELPLLTENERQQLLVEWNQIQPSADDAPCIQQLFEQQVARSPEAVAVAFENQQLTYAELNRQANQLAHYLKKRGVGPEVLVGICVERSIAMVVGLLGILKAGGAYLPLDPSYPEERLAFMVEDAGVEVLVVQQELLRNLPRSVTEIVRIDADWDQISLESSDHPESETVGENAAYVIYTSGSTGKPKGVIVTHRNVVRLFEATDSSYKFTAKDVWTLFHSYAFDFSVWEIWGALLYGGKLVIVPYWVSRSAEGFYRLLLDQKVTVLNQTPSAFRQLIELDSKSKSELSLRLVIFGGEALEFHTLKPWFDRHGDEHPQLVNMYGITETTVHVTYRSLRMADANRSVIGRPLADLQVFVLDRYLQPAPIGVPGEMYVGGAGLGRGYLKRPELTSERFIPHPFSVEPGARLYKTGDVARFLNDGDLEYLGRADDQVKIRGYRIELGEINANLAEHPAVRESVIVMRGRGSDDRRLVAYVVLAAGSTSRISELREFLKQTLPDYMVPANFVFLEAMPLTASGKVNQRALPAPEQTSVETPFALPRTPIEVLLVSIWSNVLKLDRVGIDDNFFELGGHSLLAMQVMARIRDAFQVEVPLRRIFDRPTIAQLSRLISEAQAKEPELAGRAIKSLPRRPRVEEVISS
jgi:amino acid adenylation domain-containing protein